MRTTWTYEDSKIRIPSVFREVSWLRFLRFVWHEATGPRHQCVRSSSCWECFQLNPTPRSADVRGDVFSDFFIGLVLKKLEMMTYPIDWEIQWAKAKSNRSKSPRISKITWQLGRVLEWTFVLKAPRKRKLFFKVAPWTRTLCRKPSVLCDWDIVTRFACQWMIVDVGGVSYFDSRGGSSWKNRGWEWSKDLLVHWDGQRKQYVEERDIIWALQGISLAMLVYFGVDDRHHNLRRVSISRWHYFSMSFCGFVPKNSNNTCVWFCRKDSILWIWCVTPELHLGVFIRMC